MGKHRPNFLDPSDARLLHVLAACLCASPGCGGNAETVEPGVPADGGTGGQQEGGTDATTDRSVPDGHIPDGRADITIDTGGGDGSPIKCEPYQQEETHTVSTLPEGTPATLAAICALAGPPVESNLAARVTLSNYSQSTNLAVGRIAIATELQGQIVGPPTLELDTASDPALEDVVFSGIQASGGDFVFNAEFSQPLNPAFWPLSMTLKTTLDVTCDPNGNPQRVEAFTVLDLCGTETQPVWMSSGDQCTVCMTICEMAPSPIVPSSEGCDLPLERALSLAIEPVLRVGRSLVLRARHPALAGRIRQRWRSTAGTLRSLADGLMLWTLPETAGPHLVQVALENGNAVGVASLRWNRAA